MVYRLCVYSTGRQQERDIGTLQKYHGGFSAEWVMAWPVLELCGLGDDAWTVLCGIYLVGPKSGPAIPEGFVLRDASWLGQAFGFPIRCIWSCLFCLDFLPGRKYKEGGTDHRADFVPFCRSGNPKDTADHADSKNRCIAPSVGVDLPAACGSDAGYDFQGYVIKRDRKGIVSWILHGKCDRSFLADLSGGRQRKFIYLFQVLNTI